VLRCRSPLLAALAISLPLGGVLGASLQANPPPVDPREGTRAVASHAAELGAAAVPARAALVPRQRDSGSGDAIACAASTRPVDTCAAEASAASSSAAEPASLSQTRRRVLVALAQLESAEADSDRSEGVLDPVDRREQLEEDWVAALAAEGSGVLPTLRELWVDHTGQERVFLARVLVALGTCARSDVLSLLASEDNEGVRLALLRGLPPGAASLELLQQAFGSEDDSNRRRALLQASRPHFTQDVARTSAWLRAAGEDGDPAVRSLARALAGKASSEPPPVAVAGSW
jgi:hypothetical protein